MRTIDLTQLDRNLLADIESDLSSWTLHEQAEDSGDWQILWHAAGRRAGLVYVGSGSDGRTYWTDATSPEDAYRRLQCADLSA